MKTAKISIVGFGSIGAGLATEIAEKKNFLKRKGYDLKVVTIADADGAEIDEDGLNIKSIIEKKERVISLKLMENPELGSGCACRYAGIIKGDRR